MKSAAVVLALTAFAAAASASAVPTGMRRADVPYSLPPAIARQTREMRETQQWQPLIHSAENAAKQQTQAEGRVGDDPADSWMAYTLSKGNGQLLTLVNATWKVPSNPNEMDSGNAPGWWYGIEPAPASDLIQPILAWGYPDPSYTIFNGYFQWDNQNWWFSDQGSVLPGQTVVASVWYEAGNSSYTMFIGCVETGWGVYSSIPIETGKLYTDTYFVMEHQPDDCAQLPASGKITFTDIIIQLNNKPVTAQWSAQQYEPACNSNAQVISPSSVAFTWDTSASAATAKPDDA